MCAKSYWTFCLFLSVTRVTPWSTTLWGTRSGWAPVSQRISICHQFEAQPACWPHANLAPTIFSVWASEATTLVKKSPWSLELSYCECCVSWLLILLIVLFFCSTCVSVTDLLKQQVNHLLLTWHSLSICLPMQKWVRVHIWFKLGLLCKKNPCPFISSFAFCAFYLEFTVCQKISDIFLHSSGFFCLF